MDLGEMIVSYRADMSAYTTGLAQAITGMSDFGDSIAKSSDVFADIKPFNASTTIDALGEAQSQLVDLGAQAQEAGSGFSTLQDDIGAAGDSSASLGGLVEEIDSVSTALDEASSQGGSFAGSIGDVGGGIGDFVSGIGMAGMQVQMFTSTVEQVGQALLGPAETAETTQLAFTTLMHSASGAKQEMQSLNTFASGTPMQTQWVDDAASKILAFGGKTQTIIPEITAIGDSLSGLGKLSEANLNSMVDVFGKVSAAGKLTGGDMMQLSDAGIPAWQALSSSMGLPIPELQKMVSSGLIPASKALPALEQGMEKVFGGGMAKQANTFSGLTSTLASNWQIAMAAMATPALKELEPELSKLGTALSSPAFQNFATVAGQGIGQALTTIVTGIGNAVTAGQGFAHFLQSNQTAMDAFEAFIVGASVAIGVGLVAAFIGWAIAMVPVVIETLAIAAPYLLIGALVGLVVFGIIETIQHWSEISKALTSAWSTSTHAIGGFFSGLGTDLHAIVNDIIGFFRKWGLDILEIMMGPVGLIMHFWQPITGFFQGIMGDIGDAFSGLGTMVHGVWDGIGADIKLAINGVIGLIDDFIGGIDSIGIHVGPVNIQPNIPEIPYLASGTPNFAGGWAIVGENGPEMVNLPGGSQVIPNGGSYPIKPSATSVASSVAANGGSTGASSGGDHTTVVQFDTTEVARMVQKRTDELVRLKLGSKGRVA